MLDGQVTNSAAVIGCTKDNRSTCKTYCMGIGSQVDVSLVTSMANVGGGFCELSKTAGPLELKVKGTIVSIH